MSIHLPMCINISYMDLMGNDSIRIAAFQNDSEWWPSHSRDGPTCFPQDRGGVAWKHKIRLNVWWNHLVCVICVFLSLLWFPVIHPDLGANCWLSSWSQWWCFWSYFIGIIWSPARLPGFSFASLTLHHFRFPDCWVAVVFSARTNWRSSSSERCSEQICLECGAEISVEIVDKGNIRRTCCIL